jgi:hypothetical protein
MALLFFKRLRQGVRFVACKKIPTIGVFEGWLTIRQSKSLDLGTLWFVPGTLWSVFGNSLGAG